MTSSSLDSGHRRLEIQGLRAVAVLMVVAFHAGLPVPGGFTGVDVFFVISGYVITALLLREAGIAGRIRIGRFYTRRARRLLPALALVVFVTVVLSFLLQTTISPFGGQLLTAKTALAALFSVSNAYLYTVPVDGYFAARSHDNPLLHTWSLGVEEQFYVVYPSVFALALLLSGVPKHRRTLAAVVAVLSTASLVAGLWLSQSTGSLPFISAPAHFSFYAPVTRAWEFGAGCLLALAPRAGIVRSRRVAMVLASAGLLLLAWAMFKVEGTATFPGWQALIPVSGALALLAAGSAAPAISAALRSRPMVFMGDLSYSWYLWHWMAIVLGPLVTTSAPNIVWALGSLLPAWVSFRYLEEPVRSGHFLPRANGLGIAFRFLAIPSLLSAIVLIGALAHWGDARTQTLARGLEDKTWGQRSGCFLANRPTETDWDRCTTGPAAARHRVLLVGDSHAESLSDGLIEAVNSRAAVTVMTAGSCPLWSDPPGEGLCPERNRQAMERVKGGEYDVVVLSQATAGYTGGSENSDAQLQLRALLEELVAERITVIVVTDVPVIGANGAPCTLGPINGPRCQVDIAALSWSLTAKKSELAAAAGIDGVTVVDSWPAFCSSRRCHSSDGETLLYLDPEHLTRAGSLRVTPLLEDVLSSAPQGVSEITGS